MSILEHLHDFGKELSTSLTILQKSSTLTFLLLNLYFAFMNSTSYLTCLQSLRISLLFSLRFYLPELFYVLIVVFNVRGLVSLFRKLLNLELIFESLSKLHILDYDTNPFYFGIIFEEMI